MHTGTFQVESDKLCYGGILSTKPSSYTCFKGTWHYEIKDFIHPDYSNRTRDITVWHDERVGGSTEPNSEELPFLKDLNSVMGIGFIGDPICIKESPKEYPNKIYYHQQLPHGVVFSTGFGNYTYCVLGHIVERKLDWLRITFIEKETVETMDHLCAGVTPEEKRDSRMGRSDCCVQ